VWDLESYLAFVEAVASGLEDDVPSPVESSQRQRDGYDDYAVSVAPDDELLDRYEWLMGRRAQMPRDDFIELLEEHRPQLTHGEYSFLKRRAMKGA